MVDRHNKAARTRTELHKCVRFVAGGNAGEPDLVGRRGPTRSDGLQHLARSARADRSTPSTEKVIRLAFPTAAHSPELNRVLKPRLCRMRRLKPRSSRTEVEDRFQADAPLPAERRLLPNRSRGVALAVPCRCWDLAVQVPRKKPSLRSLRSLRSPQRSGRRRARGFLNPWARSRPQSTQRARARAARTARTAKAKAAKARTQEPLRRPTSPKSSRRLRQAKAEVLSRS